MKEIPKWIKKGYKIKEIEHKFSQMWIIPPGIIGFVYKKSYFCKELRESFKYIPYTFQYLLDKCNFVGEGIFFNNETAFHFTHINKFIWLFNPKYAVIEVSLDDPVPMIISSPHIPFEMVFGIRIIEEIKLTENKK